LAWNLHITGPAQKAFQKLPPKDRAGVKNALLAMQEDPFSKIPSAATSNASKDRPVRGAAA